MESPLISIIVPCYNVEIYVDESFGSIINQSYQNWECIAINDGSTDCTEDKIIEWTNRDSRFKIISQENAGPSAARNAGLNAASGDCIFFFDSDDLLDKDCLKTLLALYNPSIDVVIGKSAEVQNQTGNTIQILEHISETDVIFSNKDLIELSLKTPFSVVAWNKLYCSRFLQKHKLKFKNGILHEDELWFFEIIHLAEKVIFASKVTYYYNIGNENSITKNYTFQNLKDYLTIAEHIYLHYYTTEENKEKRKMIGTYLLDLQIMDLSIFFRFLKNNRVDFKAEGVLLIKEHLKNFKIHEYSYISDEKSIMYEIFIKYAKTKPETAFKLIRNTRKRNILKFFENIFLKYLSRNPS